MAYRLVPYTAEWTSAVHACNERLKGHPETPFLLPGTAMDPEVRGPMQRRHWVAVDSEDQVRGGCLLQIQPGWAGGKAIEVCNIQSPLSEGLADRRHAGLAVWLLREITRRHPFVYSVGMGSEAKPYPRLLRALGWSVETVPFFFRVLAGRRFLAHMQPVRKHVRVGLLARAGALVPLLPDLAFAALHGWHGRDRRPAGADARAVGLGAELGFGIDRGAAMLDALYPATNPRFVRVEDNAGTVILYNSHFRGHAYFGDMSVTTLADIAGFPGERLDAALRSALSLSKRQGAELLVTNQSDPLITAALRRAGWLEYPSNYLAGLSPQLDKARAQGPIHVTRGDGDGLINL